MAKHGGSIIAVLALIGALTLGIVAPASAASSFATERVRIELLPELAGVPAEGGTVWLALDQHIAPHWHTYWKNPGDSGEPTDIEWLLPGGFNVGETLWQPPQRQPYGPLVNFGYSNQATLLMPLSVPGGLTPGERITLTANVFWLVCADVCVPEDGTVEVILPVVDGTPAQNLAAVDAFARARERLPQPSPWEARVETGEDTLRVALLGSDLAGPLAEGRITGVALFPEVSGLIDNAAAQVVRFGPEGMTLSVPVGPRIRRGAAPDMLEGLIVIDEIVGGDHVSRAVNIAAAPGTIPEGAMTRGFTAASTEAEIGLWQAALLALLGGLILNLMPCVFPVVFLKALTFVSVAHERPWRVRAHGLSYTAGILASFTLIAGLLIGLRAAGAEIGWGFQLQSPEVVAAFAVLLFAVGLNLSGVYTIGSSVMGLGGSLAERRGYSGSFFTGVLAVVVAAPCTAPFMGVALGFALTQPALIGFAVFLALGFGMALPYLLLSFAPALLKLLPRPGAWMERLKQILAIPIYAWVVYLLWVMAQQVELQFVGLTLALLLAVALGAMIFEMVRTKDRLRVTRLAALVVLVAAMGVTLAILPRSYTANDTSLQASEDFPSVPYSEADLDALREEGRTVFVNFTAAWCVTCLINERVVFSDADFVARFEAAGAVYMKGDWTNRDAEISRALERFGRPGVPLYVVYRPGEPPQVLPQVLTAAIVLNALED